MNIKIEYKTDNDGYKYASTIINDNFYVAVDKDSFDIAKAKLINRIKEAMRIIPTIIPEPEEVEIGD